MAKAVADTNEDNQGGFASDSTAVTGFSHMHDSGTGGVSQELYQSTSANASGEAKGISSSLCTKFSQSHYSVLVIYSSVKR